MSKSKSESGGYFYNWSGDTYINGAKMTPIESPKNPDVFYEPQDLPLEDIFRYLNLTEEGPVSHREINRPFRQVSKEEHYGKLPMSAAGILGLLSSD